MNPFSAHQHEQFEDSLMDRRITSSPDICHGKPCLRGLRYPIEFILEPLSRGMSDQDIPIPMSPFV